MKSPREEKYNMLIAQTTISRTALKGHVAVVTGAGQGIGRETARALAYLGASVVIAEINETGLETQQLILQEGGTALFVKTDVADPASMEHLHNLVQESLGDVDILVNNAAAFTTKPILEHTVEEWDRIFAVNLRGAFLGIKAFLPTMLERRRGVIVTMESAEGMPFLAPYLASKVGLRSLALSLAQELGEQSGVAVYCFGAGIVDTPGGMEAFKRLAPRYGLSLEEFIQQAGIPLISAELCAVGLVGTILSASEFHGQETGYAAGLSILGLTPTGEQEDQLRTGASSMLVSSELLTQAIVLNRQLEAILQANIKEYDEQSMFVRPVVKRMFKQGTGMTATEWLEQAQSMTNHLERLSRQNATLDPSRVITYIAQLKRLAVYIKKQEGDARGWIKDPKQLKEALEALHAREEIVCKQASLLSEMVK
jgi:NAD(P)-dependent dehydrogenase (short-subunit alcohol dehydrogenase family)